MRDSSAILFKLKLKRCRQGLIRMLGLHFWVVYSKNLPIDFISINEFRLIVIIIFKVKSKIMEKDLSHQK